MKPEETTAPFGKPVLMHIFRSVFPNQMFLTNWILRLPYQLADLIDRPTCEDVFVPRGDGFTPYVEFKCSACGCSHVSLTYVCYCPNCGAEVVDDD